MKHRPTFLTAYAVGLLLLILPQDCNGQYDEEPEQVSEPKSGWYQKYPKYPEYCSTPLQLDSRSIPGLDFAGSDTKLVHVTAVLKHGARTIFAKKENKNKKNYDDPDPQNQCWEGYWEDESTARWDCALKTVLAPPNPERLFREEGLSSAESAYTQKSMLLFDKTYDALREPQGNYLNGTCQQGQLIMQGYEQAVEMGKQLRAAYLYEEDGMNMNDHAEDMRLFDVNPMMEMNPKKQQPWQREEKLYLRADDAQQTLMSGQLLLRGLFEQELTDSRNYNEYGDKSFPTIPVHTADHSRDILGGFQEHCDLLDALQVKSSDSKEYRHFLASQETQEVRAFLEGSQLVPNDPGLLDCLMTTVCTDRPLPARFGIYNPHPNSWFNRIAAYHAKNHSFHLQYNDAEYSKLSMGPLWAEILDHIVPVIDIDAAQKDRPRPPAKLAIYSGYDSTIMQLLSSLGPDVWDGAEWPPYASMVLVEIHEFVDDSRDQKLFPSEFAFRLIYNGKILTDQVEGCHEGLELCDTKTLLARVQPFATRAVDCVDPEAGRVHPMKVAKSLVTKTGGILLILLIVAVSGIVGAMGVFFYLTGSLPTEEIMGLQKRISSKLFGKNYGSVEEDLSLGDDDVSQHSRRTSMVTDNFETELSDAAAQEGAEQ